MTPPITIDGCDTLAKLFWLRVQEHSGDVALREKDLGIWNEYTWRDYGDRARWTGLGPEGARPRSAATSAAIASEINKEWMFADMGVICAGGVVNGVYPTDAPNQVEYLITRQQDEVLPRRRRRAAGQGARGARAARRRCRRSSSSTWKGLRGLLNDEQCMSFEALQELGRQYLSEHPEAWEAEIEAIGAEDLMVLTYTSGTTGMPKGSMIHHRNALYQAIAVTTMLDFRPGDEQLGFLPLAHIAGRVFYIFCVIAARARVNLVESLETVVQDMQEVAPTVHFAVPRVWEKQYSAVTIKLEEATPLGRWDLREGAGHRPSRRRIQEARTNRPLWSAASPARAR